MADENDTTSAASAVELTDEQKQQNVIRLAFGGSEQKYDEFVAT